MSTPRKSEDPSPSQIWNGNDYVVHNQHHSSGKPLSEDEILKREELLKKEYAENQDQHEELDEDLSAF